jgi:hypothetical protein
MIDRKYAEAIRPVRNRLRKFSYKSALLALSSYLSEQEDTAKVDKLKKLPWVAERLVIWVLSDQPCFYKNALMSESDVRTCIDDAWSMADNLHHHMGGIQNIELFVRQQMLPQAPYQVGLNAGAFGRQMLMVKKLEPNSRLRIFLDQKAGMPIEYFFEMAFLPWTNSDDGRSNLEIPFLKELVGLYGIDVVKNFIQRVAPPLHEVRQKIKESRQVISLDEWFQPTLLYKYPYLNIGTSIISWGAPNVRRYFEHLVSDWLEDAGEQGLKQHWEKIFNEYIGQSLRRTGKTVLPESEIKQQLKLQGRVCDYLLEDEKCVVLVEVKHKSLTDRLPARDWPKKLNSKLKETVVGGLDQLEITKEAVMSHAQFNGKTIYKMIVTSSDLWLGSGSFLRQNLEEKGINRTFIFSADDLDHLCELERLGRATFNSFFQDLSAAKSSSGNCFLLTFDVVTQKAVCIKFCSRAFGFNES